jgi:hypothetical protein
MWLSKTSPIRGITFSIFFRLPLYGTIFIVASNVCCYPPLCRSALNTRLKLGICQEECLLHILHLLYKHLKNNYEDQTIQMHLLCVND